MSLSHSSLRPVLAACGFAAATLALGTRPLAQTRPAAPAPQSPSAPIVGCPASRPGGSDSDADKAAQARTDAVWQANTAGVMNMKKTTYKSRADGLDIPVWVFTPLTPRADKSSAALVWVHPDIRGHLYEYYIPYVKDAIAKGYIVVAPEYRGSIGYGKAFFDAIDYGGAEVDDVVTAVSYITSNLPMVDPSRVGIIGWSHGGMITMLSISREPTLFKAAAAMVPVTNLFQRLAWKGVERQHQLIDPANRYGGLPSDRAAQQIYKDRSPLYQIDKIQTPVIVHVTKNDADVNIEEDEQLVDALRSRKADLAETKVYENPVGGHLFDRQVNAATCTPLNTHEQRDSWTRVWAFLDWYLNPGNEKIGG